MNFFFEAGSAEDCSCALVFSIYQVSHLCEVSRPIKHSFIYLYSIKSWSVPQAPTTRTLLMTQLCKTPWRSIERHQVTPDMLNLLLATGIQEFRPAPDMEYLLAAFHACSLRAISLDRTAPVSPITIRLPEYQSATPRIPSCLLLSIEDGSSELYDPALRVSFIWLMPLLARSHGLPLCKTVSKTSFHHGPLNRLPLAADEIALILTSCRGVRLHGGSWRQM